MGFNDLNPSDSIESAIKRGDDYFVVLAESDDVTFATPIQFTSPVAGFAIGQNSDFDQCGIQFNFPAQSDSVSQTRVVCVDGPLIARLPPTGVQESPTISLLTGDAGGNINLLRPTNRTLMDVSGFPILELYVYLRNPTASPPMRRRDRVIETSGITAAGIEIQIGHLYAFGRRSYSASVIAGNPGGTLRVYQKSLISNLVVTLTKITEVVLTAGEQMAVEGLLHGADVVLVTFQTAGDSSMDLHLEVRD